VVLESYGVDEIFEVTGRFDIICIIDEDTMEHLNDILEKIRAIDGVNHTETFTVLKTRFG
jgi:DNA-binding Lrp family transcriptional regulator